MELKAKRVWPGTWTLNGFVLTNKSTKSSRCGSDRTLWHVSKMTDDNWLNAELVAKFGSFKEAKAFASSASH